MRIIVLFPDVAAATPFLLAEPRQAVFVAGTDPAEMAAGTVRAIRAKKPHLVVLAGTAAACDERIPPGSVVEVVASRMEGGTLEYAATGPATGLPEAVSATCCDIRSAACAAENATAAGDDPLSLSANDPAAGSDAEIAPRPAANDAPGSAPDDRPDDEADEPLVAEREGAAFFAVCEAMETACLQIRAVTHRRGEHPDPEQVRTALQTLAETLVDTLGRLAEAEA